MIREGPHTMFLLQIHCLRYGLQPFGAWASIFAHIRPGVAQLSVRAKGRGTFYVPRAKRR